MPTPFGPFGIRTVGRGSRAYIDETAYLPFGTTLQAAADALTARAERLVLDYLARPTTPFDLPLAPSGTPFQSKVWELLRRLEAGETASYGDLARHLGSAARAVGGACRRNPIPLFIPCHRVLSKTGLGGFCGAVQGPMLEVKSWLLRHEHGQTPRR